MVLDDDRDITGLLLLQGLLKGRLWRACLRLSDTLPSRFWMRSCLRRIIVPALMWFWYRSVPAGKG